MKESKKTISKEIKYMKKGGAPKELIRHEEREREDLGGRKKMKPKKR